MRLIALIFVLPLCAADYDLAIRNARVLDGSGSPWFRADIGVKDGRIRAIGTLAGDATRVIDAAGRYVAPGFIDLHSHSDGGIGSPELRANLNMVAQGITLSVLNQDGRSPYPLARQRALYEKQGVGNNVILLAGHGMLRNRIMQRRASEAATDDDIRAMTQLLVEELKSGGWGLSAGLEYVPGRFAETRELVELAHAVRPFGGVYISHERSEGRDPMWKNASDPTPAADLLGAVRETIEIGRSAGIPVVCSHIKAKGAGYWGSSAAAMRLIRDARDEGVEVYADQYPYDTSGTDGNTVLIPLWALAAEGSSVGGQLGQLAGGRAAFGNAKENLALRMRIPEEERKIRLDIGHEIARRGGADRIVIYEFPDAKYTGKTLAAIAAELSLSPIDAALWILRNGFDGRNGGARMRGFSLDESDIEHIMRQEFTATSTDGGTVAYGAGVPHARFYGSYPRKLRRYVVERKTISLAFAIRSMTGLAAQILGLKDRGAIREGYWADLVIFDLAAVADKATFTSPHQYPEGIPFVFVNGVAVVDAGKLTSVTPGKVLTPAIDGTRAPR